ncbi:hypothetical protein DEI95_08230 [Curtobacterium sp. MCBD17_008]|nr:hypothetical protein DEI95_08230 [Curtobacterium sp. MCBD17_008]
MRGILRSTETAESEGEGPDLSSAGTAAIAGIDLEQFELLQANTVGSKATGESTEKAVARSRAQQPHEATGKNYDDAIRAYLEPIPNGWRSLYVTVEG